MSMTAKPMVNVLEYVGNTLFCLFDQELPKRKVLGFNANLL